MADPAAGSNSRPIIILATGVFALLLMLTAYACDDGQSRKPTGSTPTSATSALPPYEAIPGDGTYPVGTIDGKNFGIWQSSPAPAECIWSIVAKDNYEPVVVLDHGTGIPGEVARANVQPKGDHPILFITHGCGTWHLVD